MFAPSWETTTKMSIDELPHEVIQIIAEQWPCRDTQLRQLRLLLDPRLPSASTIIVQGPRAAGKTTIVRAYLQAIEIPHIIVNCDECITERHLLEHTIASIENGLNGPPENGSTRRAARCENLNSFSSQLQDLLSHQAKFVIVFDGIDNQREASHTLAPALTRLGEIIAGLTTVMIVRDSTISAWRRSGLPYVVFPTYSRAQAIHIVSRTPEDIYPTSESASLNDAAHKEDKEWLWPRFCAAVWDSLGQSAARDLVSFSELCHKLWRPFVQPIVAGELGTRDFSRLMVMQRRLFQDESVLMDHLLDVDHETDDSSSRLQLRLPYYTRWILLAAYLASTIPARLDATYFMKTTEKKKRRKKGSGIARLASKSAQMNKIPRHLMAPTPFSLDRLLAIIHAILPDQFRATLDVSTQITTLTSLRLLTRSAGFGLGDAVEAGSKWKIGPAITWEFVSVLAGSLDFVLADYTID